MRHLLPIALLSILCGCSGIPIEPIPLEDAGEDVGCLCGTSSFLAPECCPNHAARSIQ